METTVYVYNLYIYNKYQQQLSCTDPKVFQSGDTLDQIFKEHFQPTQGFNLQVLALKLGQLI